MPSVASLTKAVLLLTLLGNMTTAWSHHFYVGVGAGPEMVDFNSNSVVSSPSNFFVTNNSHLSGTGFFGSIFGGYAWIHQAFYLAGEAKLDVTNVKSQASNNEFIHQSFSTAYYRMRRDISFSVLPGYLFTPTTLFYGRLGYSLAYFNISSTDASLSNMNKNLSGIGFGLGINQALNQQFSLRLEYSQVYYQSTSSTTLDRLSNVQKNTNIAPTTGQAEFALLYHFN